ncbi:MAG: formylglycine-generating enzyme family protein [Rivularia sp. (in: cyanobacteria)]
MYRGFSEKTYRLPSEAEWEYACRAGTTTPFNFGESITTDLASYDGNYTYGYAAKDQYRNRKQTTDVGIFPANTFGLYDMHGNVWEWCLDDWHDNYKEAPNDGTFWQNNELFNTRLLRGGSWVTLPRRCRSASRSGNDHVLRFNDVGFRVVLVLPRT